MPIPISLRLFLPDTWIKNRERLHRAGVPEAFWAERSKPEIALAELQRVMQAGVRFGAVLADAGYGISASFRQALSALGLKWAVGTVRIQKVYPADAQMIASATTRGRPRRTPIPDQESISAEAILSKTSWRRITWRRGTKGPLQARFAAVRVRIADGPAVQLHGHAAQHLPGEEVWLVGEHRLSGERKYYLSNLPPKASLKQLAFLIKARWICEQAHQQLKGRAWARSLRGALVARAASTCADDADRLSVPAASAFTGSHRGERKASEPPPQPSLPAIRRRLLYHLAHALPLRCPFCRARFTPDPMGRVPK